MDRVLAFWFGQEGDPDWGQSRHDWFNKSDAFDQACRDGFLDLHEQAARAAISMTGWQAPRGRWRF